MRKIFFRCNKFAVLSSLHKLQNKNIITLPNGSQSLTKSGGCFSFAVSRNYYHEALGCFDGRLFHCRRFLFLDRFGNRCFFAFCNLHFSSWFLKNLWAISSATE